MSAATLTGVRPGYVHVTKEIVPAAPLLGDRSRLKWYEIAPADAPVPAAVGARARGRIEEALAAGELEAEGLGFVILHRCGDAFYFLIVCTWQGDNEVWETVWAKNGAEAAFAPWPREGSHVPTFCVWELGAVWHEQQAWTRFLRSERDAAAAAAYLEDTCRASV